MGHDIWDSQRNRDINRSKDTVTDHRCEDYRYHSITGQAMIKDRKSRLFTVLQDSILLEYDIVSLGKRFPICVWIQHLHFQGSVSPWRNIRTYYPMTASYPRRMELPHHRSFHIILKTIKMHLTKLRSIVIISEVINNIWLPRYPICRRVQA
jgi:hypothetical protein